MQPKTEHTGFYDKTGKPIHSYDILQIRAYGRHEGPVRCKIVPYDKHFHLVPEGHNDPEYAGPRFTKELASRTVVLEHSQN